MNIWAVIGCVVGIESQIQSNRSLILEYHGLAVYLQSSTAIDVDVFPFLGVVNFLSAFFQIGWLASNLYLNILVLDGILRLTVYSLS